MDVKELKDQLDEAVKENNTQGFVKKDPVQFPRRFKEKRDIEISAFLTATITWGKREIIIKSAEKMHKIIGESPSDYIDNEKYEKLGTANLHRTFFEHDMAYLCRGLHAIYKEHDSIEELFTAAGENRIWEGIRLFREYIFLANGEDKCRSLKHISNPEQSACKRLHLALRWLVRNDDIVDLGIWKNISPSELFIPLDTHVITTACKYELLKSKQSNRKAVEELTGKLRELNPADPIIYDFALFGLGEEDKRSQPCRKRKATRR